VSAQRVARPGCTAAGRARDPGPVEPGHTAAEYWYERTRLRGSEWVAYGLIVVGTICVSKLVFHNGGGVGAWPGLLVMSHVVGLASACGRRRLTRARRLAGERTGEAADPIRTDG